MKAFVNLLSRALGVEPLDLDIEIHDAMSLEDIETLLSKVQRIPAQYYSVLNESLDKVKASFDARVVKINEYEKKIGQLQDSQFMADCNLECKRLGEQLDATISEMVEYQDATTKLFIHYVNVRDMVLESYDRGIPNLR